MVLEVIANPSQIACAALLCVWSFAVCADAEGNLNIQVLAVSVVQAAELLGVSPRTVQNFIARKEIPSRKLGRRRVIRMADLEKFLRSDHSHAIPDKTKAEEVRY